MNDQQVFNSIDWTDLLDPKEIILGDRGFQHYKVLSKSRVNAINKISKLDEKEIDRKRIIIENVFAWFSRFNIISNKFRCKTFRSDSIDFNDLLIKHNEIWIILAAIYNSFGLVRKKG